MRCEALALDNDEVADSIEGLRAGAMGLVSGRLGRDGGGMVVVIGDAGGEMAADDSEGDVGCRRWAYAGDRVDAMKVVEDTAGGVRGWAGVGQRATGEV